MNAGSWEEELIRKYESVAGTPTLAHAGGGMTTELPRAKW
jgi:hypothetical protein